MVIVLHWIVLLCALAVWESAALQRCIVCLLVFGPCVLACLYLVNVPLRVVCFVRKPAGFVETPNSVQRHPKSVTTWGLQVEQGSRGVWDRPRQIGFGAQVQAPSKVASAGQAKELKGRSSRHQGGGKIYRKVGLSSSHCVLCFEKDAD